MENEDLQVRTGSRPPGGETALLVIVLAAAAVLRSWNLSWGLPDIYEEATPFMVARSFWGAPGGNIGFRPDFFHYPALTFYLHFFVQGVQYLAGALTGQFTTIDAFRGALGTDPGGFMVAARSVSVLFDLGTVALGWLTARQMFGRWTAFGTALLLAFNPLLLEGAQGVNVDVVLTFFMMLTLHQSVKLGGNPPTRQFVLTGIVIGLAISTKYTGALFLLLPAAVLLSGLTTSRHTDSSAFRRTIGRGLLIPLCACLVFVALNPYMLIDLPGFLRDFTYEEYHMAYGHLGLDLSQTAGEFYLIGTLLPGFGMVFVAGLVAGIVTTIAKREAGGIGAVLMAVVYLAVISSWTMRAGRYLLPVIPLLAILCAAGCVRVARSVRIPGMAWRSLSRLLPGISVLAALIVPVRGSLAYLDRSGRTDTRTLAREWIDENVSPGSVIASGPFGITFPPGRQVVYIPFVATASEATAPFYDVRWYEDFELLIASDYDYARYAREPGRFSEILKFYADLRNGWNLLEEISADSLTRGPVLWFYTPGRTGHPEEFDRALLARLSTVSDSGLVADFAHNLSGALYARGRMRKCEQILQLGLRFEPRNSSLTRSLAFVLYKEGRFAEAEGVLRRAGSAEGESFDLLTLRGTILTETGNPVEAEKLLLRARELRPRSTLPYTLLLRIYSERRDTNALLETLKRYRLVVPRGTEEESRAAAWIDSLVKRREVPAIRSAPD